MNVHKLQKILSILHECNLSEDEIAAANGVIYFSMPGCIDPGTQYGDRLEELGASFDYNLGWHISVADAGTASTTLPLEPFKIFLTKRNADTTEGRGPMVNDKAFLHRPHAEEYIDKQPGVMGRMAEWSTQPYGDWEIEEKTVYTREFSTADAVAELRAKALQKAKGALSQAELQALGLV